MICAQVGTRPVAASAAAAADLKRRNPGTFDEKLYKPLVPRNASAPVPIMLGALEGPAALAPLATDAPYFPLAMGPAWAGVPGARRVEYVSRRKKNHTQTVSVGGFVEGWALGAIPLRKNVALGTAPTSIADSLGIASMAPARCLMSGSHWPEATSGYTLSSPRTRGRC